MQITSSFYPQYTGNYPKTAKSGKSSGTFADILQKTNADASVKPTQYAIRAPSLPKPKSVFDIPQSEWRPRLYKAIEASSNIDTTGMTNAEIYTKVESIFAGYLGKDFMNPSIIYFGQGGVRANYSGIQQFGIGIKNRFHSVLLRQANHVIWTDSQLHIERTKRIYWNVGS